MGVFTEQVQGLVSEERTKRQERERKQREKNFLQELEKELYYLFNDAFEQNKDKEKTYIFLTNFNNKCEILKSITRKIKEDRQEYYYYLLELKYNVILNRAKQNFLIEYRYNQKKEKNKNDLIWQQKAQNILNNTMHLQPKAKKIDKTKIIFIVLLPIVSLYYLFKGALYPKRKKRR